MNRKKTAKSVGTALKRIDELDVIKTADWLIDLGPEGGQGGGELLASGPPEVIARCKRSETGRYLKPLLRRQRAA